MTVEDKFPVGMRVLAVDDDPICLKVLENLLKKCQYQVTTTNSSVQALRMLRENRNKYDLVISDVNMPDMDGFKLLELVGLEMDLPVIMLSAHSDRELVYKGVTHGAVDYLLKPVRIEELKNIWQHVIRRKKLHPKDPNWPANQDKPREGAGEGATTSGSADQNSKGNRKRKDQDDDEEDEGEENFNEGEDSGSQKKPRVVWSVELHRKFVVAVNQLGLDKAVPKKILDLMNVEGLTRENVASHLQKYRLYLKRISVASQQMNMVPAFGGDKELSYLRMGSLDGLGDFRTLSGPGKISTTSISSYPPGGGMLCRLKSPSGLTLRGIALSGLLQPCHSQNMTNQTANTLGKIQSTRLPASQSANMFQGTPLQLDPNQLQGKSNTDIGDFNRSDDTSGFRLATNFSDTRVTVGNSSNPLMLQVNPQPNQTRGALSTKPSSLSVSSMNQDSFDVGLHGSSNFLDHSRCNDNWQTAVELSKFPTNCLPLSEPFNLDASSTNNLRENMPITSSQIGNNPNNYSSSHVLTTPSDSSALMGNVLQNMNYNSRQNWNEHCQDYNPNLNNSFNAMNSLVSGNGVAGSMSQLNHLHSSMFQHTNVEQSGLEPKMRSNEDGLMEPMKSQNGVIQNNYESLDDITNSMMKQQEHNETMLMDGEFGFDSYSLGSCL